MTEYGATACFGLLIRVVHFHIPAYERVVRLSVPLDLRFDVGDLSRALEHATGIRSCVVTRTVKGVGADLL